MSVPSRCAAVEDEPTDGVADVDSVDQTVAIADQTVAIVDQMRADVLAGLSASPKTLPAKYFYDERGSRLFLAISETPEYYLTRSELAIMEEHADEIAAALGPGCLLVEYGSGAADKAHLVLDLLQDPAGYISIDISKEHLDSAVDTLAAAYPDLEVIGLAADFTTDFELPTLQRPVRRRVIYFAGSTIGNFEPEQAQQLLRSMRKQLRAGDGLLIGIDLKKNEERLLSAYNDRAGHTAAFNRNILVRINRELGSDFVPDLFEHRAVYNPDLDRIEMHLESREDQVVHVDGARFSFAKGETIHTESSHKYELTEFATKAAAIGFRLRHAWTDAERNFGVLFLDVAANVDQTVENVDRTVGIIDE